MELLSENDVHISHTVRKCVKLYFGQEWHYVRETGWPRCASGRAIRGPDILPLSRSASAL